MKTMCPPGYYHSDLVVIQALGHVLYMIDSTQHHVPKCMNCQKVIAVITGGHIVCMITYYIYGYICIV